MQFDPKTGMPINDGATGGQPQQGPKFDPVTGQPIASDININKNTDTQQGPKFDPVTGQPIVSGAGTQQGPKFDPATGQPIVFGAGTQQGPKFDPATGMPIGQNTYSNAAFNNTYMNGTPAQAPKNKMPKAAKIGVAVVAAGAVAGVGVGGFFLLGGNANAKVYKAAVNTFSAEGPIDTSVLKDSADDLNVAVNFTADYEGSSVSANMNYAKSKKEMSLSGGCTYSGMTTDFGVYMNDSEVRAELPLLFDESVYYNYVDDKSGAVVDYLAENGDDYTTEDIDAALSLLYNSGDLAAKFQSACKKSADGLEFTKTDSEKFTVNGKSKECAGYTTTITDETLEDFSKIFEEEFSEYSDLIDKFIEDDSSDMVKDAGIDEIEDMEDSDSAVATFYLSDNQIAAIILEDGEESSDDADDSDDTIKILLEGGDYAAQNMKVYQGDKCLYTIEGETKDGVTTQTTTLFDGTVASMTYDEESGDLSYTYTDASYGSVTCSGTLENNKDGITIVIDELTSSELTVDNFNLEIAITKGAQIKEVDKTEDSVDLGNASEEELTALSDEMSSNFNELIGDYSYGYDY